MAIYKAERSGTYAITGEQITAIFAALSDIDRVRASLTDRSPATEEAVVALQRAADGVYDTLNGLPKGLRA